MGEAGEAPGCPELAPFRNPTPPRDRSRCRAATQCRRRKAAPAAAAHAALPPAAALLLLAGARLASAALNIIHDCDETFNYLEPLHYLAHGSGMQTWEYSARYALRSYLYLLLHAPPVAAAAALLGEGRGERAGGVRPAPGQDPGRRPRAAADPRAC